MHWSELVEDGIIRIRCDHKPHAYVAQSALIAGEEGLFADRCFKSGDTVAVSPAKQCHSMLKLFRATLLIWQRGESQLDCEHSGAPYAHKIGRARGRGGEQTAKF